MKKIISTLLCVVLLASMAFPVDAIEEPTITDAQQLADYLRTKITPGGDAAKIKTADGGNTVQVSTPVTLDVPFTIPSGVKLQQFVKMNINETIIVQGKIQDSRGAEYRADGLVGTGTGTVVIDTYGSYFQQGIEVVGSNGLFVLDSDSSVTLLSNNRLEITTGTVTVPAGKSITSDILKGIIVAPGANFNINGTVEVPIDWGDTGVDKTALIEAIADANNFKASVKVSVDSSDVSNSKKWVTQDVMDSYSHAISLALEVRNDSAATQSDVDNAIDVLEAATDVFLAAMQDGTNDEAAVEIETVADLAEFLKTITVDDSKVMISGNAALLYEDIEINRDFIIPSGVKLQTFANIKTDATITVYGTVQDSRTPENRTDGLIETGSGSFVFHTGGSYYQQGTEVIGPNGIFKLGSDASLTLFKNNHAEITSGSVTLAKQINSGVIEKITVAVGAIFHADSSKIGEGVIYIPVGVNQTKLGETIKLAEANLNATLVSNDGADIDADMYWVTQLDHDTFALAIQQAKATKNGPDATEEELGLALDDLGAAMDHFIAAKKQGLIPVAEITTAEQLLSVINSFKEGEEDVARQLSDEVVNGVTLDVIEVFKPVTIKRNITVPENVRLRFTAQMTVNAKITVKGQLQDFRDEGFIIGNGIVGAAGVGSVVFEPGSALYIKGKGETIGNTGILKIEDGSTVTLFAKNRMEITKGSAIVLKSLITSLTNELTVGASAVLTVIGSIPKEIAVRSEGTYIDASILNTEEKLGIEGTTVTSSDETIVTASVQNGRINLLVNTKDEGNAVVTVSTADNKTASIQISVNHGAIEEKTIKKYGALSTSELKAMIQYKISELETLISQAESKKLDAEREKGALWFAKEFDKYADWDEQNISVNQKMFDNISWYRPGGKTAEELAKELPEFERMEIIAMLDTAIAELTEVINGTMVRRPVRLVDWNGISLQGSNFYSNGKPVFLHDYFSKPLDVPTDDQMLYNHYLGNIDHPESLNPSLISDSNGTPTLGKYDSLMNRPTNSMGYTILWHEPAPDWAVAQYGETLRDGITTFTKYDINNPEIRNIWEKVLGNTGPITSGKPYTELGYLLANEPHWFLEKGHWAVPKKVNGQEGISDLALQAFAQWLSERHGTVSQMNAIWGTTFSSFNEAAATVIPLEKSYKGTPIGYDVSLFNMERGTEWLTFLHDQVKLNDPGAKTHIKIMPDLFAEGNRTHGIDFEKLTEMVEIIGDDAKTRKLNVRATGSSEDWADHYAYYWKELGMSYDFMHSVSPDKAHVNSEVHFLSTTAYRDLYMKPEYVRSTYWLATILGMDAGFTWFWGRNPDGSIENRLMTTSVQGLLESYPGSVAQQPRVANELSKTMMDLNAFSEEIVKFQTQKKPIRIFYSETSAINDEHYMDDLFDLYESMYFDGVPIGFATKNIIKKQPNSDWDVIVVYETQEVTDEEFDVLQDYLDQGGTVIIDNASLKFNEYKQPRAASLKASNGTLIVKADHDVQSMATSAFGIVSANGHMPPVVVTETNGNTKKGAMWRVVPNGENRYVMTILNLGKNQATLDVSMVNGMNITVTDLLTGKRMGNSFSLDPEGVMLLEIKALPRTNHGHEPGADTSNSSEVEVVNKPVVNEGKIEVSVDKGKNKLILPANAKEINGTNMLQLTNESFKVIIPANVLESLKLKATEDMLINAGITFEFKPMDEAEKRTLLTNASKKNHVNLNPVTGIYHFSLSLNDQKGDLISSATIEEPIRIELVVSPKADSNLLGMYFVGEDGTLEYVGGEIIDGKLVAKVNRLGKYVGLEYKKVYTDVSETYWAADAIQSVTAKHIIIGVEDDKYEPHRSVTRAEFAAMLVRMLGLSVQYTASSSPFQDVSETDWFADEVAAAYATGIVHGKNDGIFMPNAAITRQEMAVMIIRAYEVAHSTGVSTENPEFSFADMDQINEWTKPSIAAAIELGLLRGRTNNLFAPLDETTRAESAQVIARLLMFL